MNKIVFVGLLFISTMIHAQKKSIKGKIIDATSSEAVVNAAVQVQGTNLYTSSDVNGLFSITVPENAELRITHTNYKEVFVKASPEMIVRLTEKRISLEEIIIKSDPLQDISHSVVVMDAIKKGSQPRNVSDLFHDIPGFSIQKRSASSIEPSLRAFKYEQMNVKYDGGAKIVNACPNRMDPAMAHVIPEEVRKIEIVKGPFSVRFGQSFGGIINVLTKTPTPDDYGLHGSVQSGYETNGENFVARAEMVYATEKYDIIADGERRDFGDYTDGDGILTKSGFETNSYAIKLGYNPKSNQRLQVDWRQKFSKDIMHVGLMMDSPKDDSYMASLDYRMDYLSEKINKLTFKTYYSYVDHLMTNGFESSDYTRPNYPGIDARTPVWSKTLGGKFELGLKPTEEWQIYTGVDLDIIQRDGDKTVYVNVNPSTGQPLNNPITKHLSVWQEATINDMGLFAEANYRLNKKLTTTIGLRTDYVTASMADPDPGMLALYGGNIEDVTDVTLGGNMALKYKDKSLQVQLALGRGTRTPSMIERYIYRFSIGMDSRDYIGNPNLKPEVNYQTELSLHKKWDKLQVGGSLFYSVLENYITAIVRNDFIATSGGCGGGPPKAPKQFWNVSANQFGGDAFVAYEIIDDLLFKSDIAYTKATNETFDEPLAQVAPLSAHFGLKYEKNKFWADFRTEIIATQKDFSTSFLETETPGHTTLDLRLGYRPFKELSIGGAILNMTDEAYYNHLNFSFKNADENNGRKIYEVGRSFSMYVKYHF